jgi:hypothetical protein
MMHVVTKRQPGRSALSELHAKELVVNNICTVEWRP